jgi:tRNA(Arg) A34 adenosine deaminase TadA
MGLVVELARRNVDEDLGGPFGAGVFEREAGRLIGAGVNRVMDQNCCVLHAEVVAIMTAQRWRGSFTLAEEGRPACEIVCSCEPCAMCLGAIVWSGVSRVVCGAREADAAAIGFDEGPKPEMWGEELRGRGIEVVRDVGRQEARGVLQHYVDSGGPIYNP